MASSAATRGGEHDAGARPATTLSRAFTPLAPSPTFSGAPRHHRPPPAERRIDDHEATQPTTTGRHSGWAQTAVPNVRAMFATTYCPASPPRGTGAAGRWRWCEHVAPRQAVPSLTALLRVGHSAVQVLGISTGCGLYTSCRLPGDDGPFRVLGRGRELPARHGSPSPTSSQHPLVVEWGQLRRLLTAPTNDLGPSGANDAHSARRTCLRRTARCFRRIVPTHQSSLFWPHLVGSRNSWPHIGVRCTKLIMCATQLLVRFVPNTWCPPLRLSGRTSAAACGAPGRPGQGDDGRAHSHYAPLRRANARRTRDCREADVRALASLGRPLPPEKRRRPGTRARVALGRSVAAVSRRVRCVRREVVATAVVSLSGGPGATSHRSR